MYAEPILVPVTLRVGVSASAYTQSPSRDLEGSTTTPILPSSAAKSRSVRAVPLATATLSRMSATHEHPPFAMISRSALPTRLLCQGDRLVVCEGAEAVLGRYALQGPLEGPRVGAAQAPPGLEVGVVDDDVGVKDVPLVVVVVDDGDLVLGEALPHP